MTKRKLLVAGSRSFEGAPFPGFADRLNWMSYCLRGTYDMVIHGGARGVDEMSGRWAAEKNYPVEVYPADWENLGKRAGYVRNQQMVKDCHAAIVMWDGKSKGTKHTIGLLEEAGLQFVVAVIDPPNSQ